MKKKTLQLLVISTLITVYAAPTKATDDEENRKIDAKDTTIRAQCNRNEKLLHSNRTLKMYCQTYMTACDIWLDDFMPNKYSELEQYKKFIQSKTACIRKAQGHFRKVVPPEKESTTVLMAGIEKKKHTTPATERTAHPAPQGTITGDFTFEVHSDTERKLEVLNNQGKVMQTILINKGINEVTKILSPLVKTGFTLRDHKRYGVFRQKLATCKPVNEHTFDNSPNKNSNEMIIFIFKGKTCTNSM